MSRKFLTRKMAMPGGILNSDSMDHVVSITVVKSTNKHSTFDKADSDTEWRPPVPHRPQPVHLVGRPSLTQMGPERERVNGEAITTGPVSPVEASTAPAYGSSNKSAFTRPGYTSNNRMGKLIKSIKLFIVQTKFYEKYIHIVMSEK